MGSQEAVADDHNENDADLAKAFQELAKGERTAAALESQLSTMEAKIEELLAQAEKEQEEVQNVTNGPHGNHAAGSSGTNQPGANS